MFRWTRLPNKHATIRFGFESADMSVGATTYGHQNWTSDKETRGRVYADDVTIFVTAPADIQIIGDPLLTYERAKGARLNTRKSKAMTAGL
jgi:hypothetical protein